MKTTKNSSHREITPISTENKVATTKQVFLDEYFFSKTDIGEYELIIVLRPKKFGRIAYIDNSDITLGQNHSNELFSIIRHYLAQEKQVERILFLKKDEVFHVWTVISEYQKPEIRRSIYNKERELMNFLARANFHFSFFLIEPDEADELLFSGSIVIYDREKLRL